MTWFKFCLFHSRFYAKQHNQQFSKLCVADKASIYLTPRWLYMFLVKFSGEYKEYMAIISKKYAAEGRAITNDVDQWYDDMTSYLRGWVAEHKDLREDKWTPVVGGKNE